MNPPLMLPPEAPAHYQRWFAAGEFRARHARLYETIGRDAVAVVQGAGPVGGFEVFRQTNEFFYLTGVEAPQAYLLLDGRARRSTLYLPHRDEHHAASEGAELSAEDADLLVRLAGVDEVAGYERLADDLRGARVVYTPRNPAEGNMACQDTLRHAARLIAADPWGAHPPREASFAALLRERVPGADVRDLSPALDAMRLVKSPAEVALLRHAGDLTARAVVEAMRSTRPGLYEYHLGAVAEYVYRVNGARGASYRPIVAAGENIWLLHYYRNNSPLRAGEVVLMDVAPDVCNYTSDIGRIWPVGGTYGDLHRQLYGFMVRFHQALLRHLGPGATAAQVMERAVADVRPHVARMTFANADHERGVLRVLEADRHLTHPVGMAVHDVGKYKDRPLEPGIVFALDPQLWIPEERIYLRVEDTVAITENGVESLTSAAPLELDEVEAIVGRGGMLQEYPPIA